jgi:triosephosphate isomerase (TIM)
MLIIANWKAYIEDLGKAKQLVAIARRLSKSNNITIVLAPPAPLIAAVVQKKSSVAIAAQDVSVTTGGAHTGESTAQAFAGAGATYAIIGHSERRTAGDTPQMVAEKLSHALAHGLVPVLCIGETIRDGEGRYLSHLREQLTTAFLQLTPKERGRVIVAYEPLWAINKTASSAIRANDLAEMVLYIRKILSELLPGRSSSRSRILYGGSVEPGNARDLAASSHVDGFLIGHASVDPNTFAQLVKELS